MSALPAAILLMGPTAAGKTDLAVALAARYPVELISVDSALVYRGMDIGTGKPNAEALSRCPHHLVDILDPGESYSAGQFVRDVTALIADIRARGRVPLLVGGTMLYFRALLRGIAAMPEADPAFRSILEQRAAQLGWPALHAELTERDPLTAARVGPNDAQRIQRALEVMHLTGRPMSAVQAEARPPLPELQFVSIGLSPADREALYARIETRFHQMMRVGFLDEVRRLFERPDLHRELPAMRAVGYRQLWRHLAGECSLEAALQQGILATRHLARRQLIWMRAEPALQWVDSTADDALIQVERKISRVFG
ncbi:MAG: tRNA (adenosine(37)-N6)-dimethylallyltransferase MiaA [Steroidobacteraceae bacterium]